MLDTRPIWRYELTSDLELRMRACQFRPSSLADAEGCYVRLPGQDWNYYVPGEVIEVNGSFVKYSFRRDFAIFDELYGMKMFERGTY